MADCVFCEIVAGRAEASMVYADEQVMAFMDTRPVTAGHLLVIPRRHAVGLADLDPADGARVFETGQQIAGWLRRSGLRCDGINLFLADGVAAGQEVFHVHLHVVPRYEDDGFQIRANWRFPPRDELDKNAALVRP